MRADYSLIGTAREPPNFTSPRTAGSFLPEIEGAFEPSASQEGPRKNEGPPPEAAYDPSRSACSAIARHVCAISNTTLLAGSKDSRLATRSYSSALARYFSALVDTAPDP
jgi:hypothetical protein